VNDLEKSAVALIERRCPVCGSTVNSPAMSKQDLRLVRCVQCEMVFASPVPGRFATGQYYDHEGAGYYLSEAKLQSDFSPVRFTRESALFRRYCRSGAVLDVGCSTGGFLYQVCRRWPGEYELVGTDVSGPAVNHARDKGLHVAAGDFMTLDFGQHFAAITLWAVLEHLLDPGAFLRRAESLLQPGGYCFVLVPNFGSLAHRLLGAKYRYVCAQHLNYFRSEHLVRLAGPGFELLEVRATHFNPLVLWQDWQRPMGEVPDAERAGLLQRTNAMKQSRWMGPARVAYRLGEQLLAAFHLADNLVVVLQKRN
jgi:2-polyprenyl-3-methyl-5-hydroxy-6-metoxy-1,4-benzoquinol methylase